MITQILLKIHIKINIEIGDKLSFTIARFQSHDMFSAWWSTPNGNTVVGSG